METTKLIAEVKEAEKRLAAGREAARNACLAAINEELAKLKSIGFEYELAGKNGNNHEKICSNCGAKGHNKRACPALQKGSEPCPNQKSTSAS